MTMKHTPLPWTQYENGGQIYNANKSFVTCVQSTLCQEDAAFIVRACNSHYDLVAALEAVTKELHELSKDEQDDYSVGIRGWSECHAKVDAANAALAKAKAGVA